MQVRWVRLLFVFGCGVAAAGAAAQNIRSVQLPHAAPAEALRKVEPAESAAMFVGIRDFTHDDVDEIRYAVDDAIDLAYAVSLDLAVPLVAPERIALALSGDPSKETSRRRRDKLSTRGATIHPAGQTDIIGLMERQAKRVGKNGTLIVAIATHGVSDDVRTAGTRSRCGRLRSTSSTSRFDGMVRRVARSDAAKGGRAHSVLPRAGVRAVVRLQRTTAHDED